MTAPVPTPDEAAVEALAKVLWEIQGYTIEPVPAAAEAFRRQAAAILASGVVVPAAESGAACARHETARRDGACLFCGRIPAAESGALTEAERGEIEAVIGNSSYLYRMIDVVERILAARAVPAREAEGVVHITAVQWAEEMAVAWEKGRQVGLHDEDYEFTPDNPYRGGATPPRDGLAERVRALAEQWEAFPCSGPEAVRQLRALLAEDAAIGGGEGRG